MLECAPLHISAGPIVTVRNLHLTMVLYDTHLCTHNSIYKLMPEGPDGRHESRDPLPTRGPTSSTPYLSLIPPRRLDRSVLNPLLPATLSVSVPQSRLPLMALGLLKPAGPVVAAV